MDVATRLQEENVAKIHEELPTLSDAESTDDELEGLATFNIDTARKDLYGLPGCYKVMITIPTQKLLAIEVGINVSQEFPWKRVKYGLMVDHYLFDEIENGDEILQCFSKYKGDDKILVGYAPSLIAQEEQVPNMDPFVIYGSEKDARAAGSIIRNMEMYDRFTMNKHLIKRPKPWVSKGSEAEVNLGVPPKKSEVVDVEIQSVYPMRKSSVQFQMRLTSDARDGYAELVAGEATFKNVMQQRVSVGTQSAPAMVTLEQQTDPTFPTNAWAQYLYEIKDDDEAGLDATSDEEEEKAKSAVTSTVATPSGEVKEVKPPPEMSDRLNFLLSILEFNQIDMYRNDYPLISTASIQIYTSPYLEEIFCFANISKSNHRYVCAVDWYPYLTGVVVAAYTFSTKVTFNSAVTKEKIDTVQRSILQPNPILMWTFMDSLNYKLEFESPREVTALSFCPYDENILIGGTINGQVIIWDLQDRAKHLEDEEHLTFRQANNRELIAEYLAWTIRYDEGIWIRPAAISGIENSQTDAITEIKWLSRHYYISTNGRIHLKPKTRYFLTLSTDGSVAYWNLDFDIGKVAKAATKKNLPQALTQNESFYKKFDKLFKPVFMVTYSEPLTSIICDTANYSYSPQIAGRNTNDAEVKTFPIIVKEAEKKPLRNSFIVGSFFGRIELISFEGVDTDNSVNKDHITSPVYSFARVHDGPIVALEKNPFYPEIFVSVGRTVMAIWKEDYPFTPILWRVRPKILTAVKWSTDRPAVLFLTRSDGSFEAWDLLARDDDACLVEVLGGGNITVLSEHRAAIPKKVISIGDYNSSFRMVALPKGFYEPVPNELQLLKAYVEKEVFRKKTIQNWQKNWREQNADIIEEKKRAEAEATRDLERLRAEAEEAKKTKDTADEKKSQPEPTKTGSYDLPERLDKKWDELNLKRLMHNLMLRKKVDPAQLDRDTALEKERLMYEERKKISVQEAISRVSEEIAAIRARLLPVEKEDVQLSDMIAAIVNRILVASPTYAEIAEEAENFLREAPPIPDITYDDVIYRCRERRQLLNKVLGIPCDRSYLCEQERGAGDYRDWDHGCEEFIQSLEASKRLLSSQQPFESAYLDLDIFPERDSTNYDAISTPRATQVSNI